MAANAFAASTNYVPTDTPKSSSQHITIPYMKPLFEKDYLNQLFPSETSDTVTESDGQSSDETTHPFATALRARAIKNCSERGGAPKVSPAFGSTKSSTLDAFSSLDPNTPGEIIHDLLQKSWQEDPETTLKIIFHLRSIHDGKSARFAFYRAFGWLYKHHPRTAIQNIHLLVEPVCEKKARRSKSKPHRSDSKSMDLVHGAESDDSDSGNRVDPEETEQEWRGYSHGYYKDLLNILALATVDQLTSPTTEFTILEQPRPNHSAEGGKQAYNRHRERQIVKKKDVEILGKDTARARTAAGVVRKERADSAASKQNKSRSSGENHSRLLRKLQLDDDASYKSLYIAVARIFASALTEDVKTLKTLSNEVLSTKEEQSLKGRLSLAAKWAPTPGCFHDRLTNISTAIASVIYAGGDMEDLRLKGNGSVSVFWIRQVELAESYLSKSAQEHSAIIRSYYRRWILVPLRRYLAVPETHMSSNTWNKISYHSVPSICLASNMRSFLEHDEERLLKYVDTLGDKRITISGATLAAHGLLMEALSGAVSGDVSLDAKAEAIVAAKWKEDVERRRRDHLRRVEEEKKRAEQAKQKADEEAKKQASGRLILQLQKGVLVQGSRGMGGRIIQVAGVAKPIEDKCKDDPPTCRCFAHRKALFFKEQRAQVLRGLQNIQKKKEDTLSAMITAQWNTMVDRIRQSGTLGDSLAICDISTSMGSYSSTIPNLKGKKTGRRNLKASSRVEPIFPGVALSLLFAQLAPGPFQNMFITFASTPRIVTINTSEGGLRDWANQISMADCGQSPNLAAVFLELLLPMAVEHGLRREDMIKRLFVFSSMELQNVVPPSESETSTGEPDTTWEAKYALITERFEEAGYDVPEIVYWNLAGGNVATLPATKDAPGVALASGFSGNLLKPFIDMDNDDDGDEERAGGEKKGKLNAMVMMKKSLGLESFSGLRVKD